MPSLPVLKPSKRKTLMCKVCFNKANESSLYNVVSDYPLCDECLSKLQPIWKKEKIDGYKHLFIYEYDNEIRELIYKYKACGDFELKDVFVSRYKRYLRMKYWGYLIVPAPSSSESDELRGFHHVDEIFKSCGFKITKCIHKKYDFKQSSLSAQERSEVKDKLEIVFGEQLRHKNVLLVDDIYTTGSTIKAMINLVKEYHPRRIEVLTISKTRDKSHDS